MVLLLPAFTTTYQLFQILILCSIFFSLSFSLQVSLDSILGTNTLPAFVSDPVSLLNADQVQERMRALEQQAPAWNFKDRDTVRNRYNRSSVPRATIERRLKTAMALQLQEYDREAAVHTIDEQWLELRTHLYRIKITDRRRTGSKRPREETEEDNCSICHHSLGNGRLHTLHCGHQLHTNCFAQLQRNNWNRRCPLCRQCHDCGEQHRVGECTALALGAQDVPVPPADAALPAEVGDEEIIGPADMDADEAYVPSSPQSTGSADSLTRHMSNLGAVIA